MFHCIVHCLVLFHIICAWKYKTSKKSSFHHIILKQLNVNYNRSNYDDCKTILKQIMA